MSSRLAMRLYSKTMPKPLNDSLQKCSLIPRNCAKEIQDILSSALSLCTIKYSEAGQGLDERATLCKSGKLGCVECKKHLTETLNVFLYPIKERRAKAESAPLEDYLREGTVCACRIGQATIEAVRTAMHLNYPTIFRRKK